MKKRFCIENKDESNMYNQVNHRSKPTKQNHVSNNSIIAQIVFDKIPEQPEKKLKWLVPTNAKKKSL